MVTWPTHVTHTRVIFLVVAATRSVRRTAKQDRADKANPPAEGGEDGGESVAAALINLWQLERT